jgi:metal transporter CNNM
LLKKGKHWVLVTLLLSNVITNETLPIVLDRSLGGGWPAVLGSTVLIVIFGEIVPQSICVRYGLPIGSWMSPFVLSLMYIMAPVAWPTAKLLDYLLGEDHGTVYKKAGLKTLVSLHKTMGDVNQQLNTDEVTIISAVLDLKEKSVGSIMTPMDDVFTLSLDDLLDEETMDDILSRGYSRIPVHHPDNNENFVGMLLVKMLITYDPEDAKPVRDFALATLPETRPDTSCLDIINFFQEGKSHMILVSEFPGEDHGAIGVVTLEDVVEEMIGEEIVDESDVFIDVHKAIRRAIPAPRMRIPKGHIVEEPNTLTVPNGNLIDIGEDEPLTSRDVERARGEQMTAMRRSVSEQRRRSSTNSKGEDTRPLRKTTTDELKEHLKHLGPSNLASRPKTTRFQSVKIKPGSVSEATKLGPLHENRAIPERRISEGGIAFSGGIGEGVLPSGGKGASDGVQALQAGYGTMVSPTSDARPVSASKGVQTKPAELDTPAKQFGETLSPEIRPKSRKTDSSSTIGSLPESRQRSKSPMHYSRGPARSGSITENIIDTNGIRKVVLETTSSSESGEDDNSGANKGRKPSNNSSSHKGSSDKSQDNSSKKKRRRKKRQGQGEGEPLLASRG